MVNDEPDLTQLLLTTLLSLNALTGQSMGSCLGNTKKDSVGLFCHSWDTNQTPHVKLFCLLKIFLGAHFGNLNSEKMDLP